MPFGLLIALFVPKVLKTASAGVTLSSQTVIAAPDLPWADPEVEIPKKGCEAAFEGVEFDHNVTFIDEPIGDTYLFKPKF